MEIGFIQLYLGIVLLIASSIDYRTMKIPNYLTFSAIITGILYNSVSGGIDGFLFSFLGLIVGMACLIIPYAIGGMGAGDVKLMGAIGAFVGSKDVFIIFLLTALYGGLYGVIMLIWIEKSVRRFLKKIFQWILIALPTRAWNLEKKSLEKKSEDLNKKPRLCYGIAIALGGYTFMVLTACGFSLY